jgi:DNA-binding transcriptional MerR regulator
MKPRNMFDLNPEQQEELLRHLDAGETSAEERRLVREGLLTWCRIVEVLKDEGATLEELHEAMQGRSVELPGDARDDSPKDSAPDQRQDAVGDEAS